MLENAHFQLQQEAEPGLKFEDCYLYGTSTANQQIEAWWQQLSKGYLFRWRVSFVQRFTPHKLLTLLRIFSVLCRLKDFLIRMI